MQFGSEDFVMKSLEGLESCGTADTGRKLVVRCRVFETEDGV